MAIRTELYLPRYRMYSVTPFSSRIGFGFCVESDEEIKSVNDRIKIMSR